MKSWTNTKKLTRSSRKANGLLKAAWARSTTFLRSSAQRWAIWNLSQSTWRPPTCAELSPKSIPQKAILKNLKNRPCCQRYPRAKVRLNRSKKVRKIRKSWSRTEEIWGRRSQQLSCPRVNLKIAKRTILMSIWWSGTPQSQSSGGSWIISVIGLVRSTRRRRWKSFTRRSPSSSEQLEGLVLHRLLRSVGPCTVLKSLHPRRRCRSRRLKSEWRVKKWST